MNARVFAAGMIRNIHCVLIAVSFISLPIMAHAGAVTSSKRSAITLHGLRADPYALNPDSGKVNVRFSVRLGGSDKIAGAVYLKRSGDPKKIAMNDLGKDGDPVAGDGVYGASVVVDTARLKPDSCIRYEAFIHGRRAKAASSSFHLCVSAFPLHIAASDISHPAEFPDGSKAVADELVMTVRQNTKTAAIQRLASDINAKVVGSIPALNFFQLKLPSAASASRLLEIVKQMRTRPEVVAASINAIGKFASSDTYYSSQHGLQQMRAQDVWASGATGSGVIVTVLDSGIDRTHPDFGTPGNCQLAENDCGGINDDSSGHGTQVAGVVAAMTNNALGVAGVAYGGKIHSIVTNSTQTAIVGGSVVYTGMVAGFNAAATYTASHASATVINASFNAVNAFANWTPVCAAIESAVWQGGLAVAVVVNAAGNEGQNATGIYPARCVDLNAGLVHKSLFIAVASNTSVVDPACGSVAIGQMCSTSNFGPWVDITASGSAIWTTAAGGSYASPSGTSFAAPTVAGAAAILNGCGVTPGNIKTALTTNTTGLPALDNILVPLPNSTSPVAQKPRLDVYLALQRLNHAPTGVTFSPIALYEKTNTAAGYDVGTLTAADSDSCDKHAYSIVGGVDAAKFSIGGVASDRLMLTDGVLNFLTKPSYSVVVRVTDFFGATFDQPLTVNVLNVNDAPAGTDATVTTSEDTVYTFSAANFGFTDPNDVPPNNLSAVIITTLPALGQLQLSGVPVVAGQSVAAASLGTLTFTPPVNANGLPYTSFTFQVVDDGGVANGGVNTDPTPNALTINVTPVNDAPNFSKGADQTVLEDAGAQSVPNWATGISAGPADEAGQTLNFIITGNTNPGLFSTPPAISPAGDLTYTTAPNANGSATITVQLHDNGGTANGGVDTSAPQSFTINVTPVNDAPTFMKGPDQSVSDNAGPQTATGWATAISAGPADEAGQALNFIISGNTNPGLFSTPPAINAAGDLTYTPMLGGNGSATITVQLHDNGGTANGGADTSAPQTFVINVSHVPVPPSGVVGINGVRQASAPQPSLHADTSGVNNPDSWSISHYQWRESIAAPPGDTPVAIGAATNVDYSLTLADVGKYMSVCAIYSDPATTQLCSGTDTIAVGDPHITTVDGLHYDFQSAGEFVSLRNSSGMEIQVRQTPVSTATPLTDAYSGLTSGVSVNSAVAARVGKHRVTYQADANNNTASGAPVLRVDGVVTTLPAEGIDFGDEGRVTPQGSGIQIDFPDQTTLIVSSGQWINNVWWMHLSVYHTSAYEGIMGARLKGSWLPRLSDGSALGAMPASLHDRYVQLYGKFADSWRVTGKTSLFDYAEGTSTATFTNKAWPTENGPYVAGPGPVAKPLGRNVAMQVCRNVAGKNEKADCVFDVMVMGNKNIAKGHLQIQNVRLGATQVIVRGADRPDAHGDMVFTATVSRQATVLPQVRSIRAVPAGMVQFVINGKKAGAPVKLDGKGQARWKVPYQRFYKQRVTAQYIPAKGSIFLPSSRIIRTGLVLEKK